MSARKPLEEGCDGGVFCPVEGHVRSIEIGGMMGIIHTQLTLGQQRTLIERRRAERRQP